MEVRRIQRSFEFEFARHTLNLIQRLAYVQSVLWFVVVSTSTRIIKSVVTGESPVTLELKNTPGKHTKQIEDQRPNG